jgi:hypothetical protein
MILQNGSHDNNSPVGQLRPLSDDVFPEEGILQQNQVVTTLVILTITESQTYLMSHLCYYDRKFNSKHL